METGRRPKSGRATPLNARPTIDSRGLAQTVAWRYYLLMNSATYRLDASTTPGAHAVVICSDSKRDAQEAIAHAKAMIRSFGLRMKMVHFHEVIGTEWSNMGATYRARIVFKK